VRLCLVDVRRKAYTGGVHSHSARKSGKVFESTLADESSLFQFENILAPAIGL
jgi:hypothetical protein